MCPPNVATETPLQPHVQGIDKAVTPPPPPLPSASSAPPPPPPLPKDDVDMQAQITAHKAKSASAIGTSKGNPSSSKPKANAGVGNNRNVMLEKIRKGVQLKKGDNKFSEELAGLRKSDDEESKKTQTSLKPVVQKQQDAQSSNGTQQKQPAKRDIGTQTVETLTIGDTDTKTVGTVTIANSTLDTKKSNIVLKYLAAISLLCTPFVAGLYFPYILSVISGAVLIAEVIFPVAIFAASAVIAMASATYLVKPIVSPASSEKKVDSKKEFTQPFKQQGNTALQESTQVFVYNATPPPLPPTTGTASFHTPQSKDPGAPPPPPPMPKGPGGPPPSPPPPPGMNPLPAAPNNGDGGRASLLDAIRNAAGKPKKNSSGSADRSPNKENKSSGTNVNGKPVNLNEALNARFNNGSTTQETSEERAARIERDLEEARRKKAAERASDNPMAKNLAARRIAITGQGASESQTNGDSTKPTALGQAAKKIPYIPPRGRSTSEGSDHDWDDEDDTSPLESEEGSNTTESGYASGDDEISQVHVAASGTAPVSVPLSNSQLNNGKVQPKPTPPPKPNDLPAKLKPAPSQRTQAPPAPTVSEVDPSTLSIKKRAKQ